ncbi:MAG: transglycosylase SLT domain-containing protein [Bacteroidetes bacterium]|nr:transglycosylase SLT domain-containing protein [Bacteroidota bacterium]
MGVLRNFIVSLLIWPAMTHAQDLVEQKLKLLEQKGLPFFYNEDIRQNAEAWIRNENASTSIITGRFNHYATVLETAQRTHGLPWFIKYIPAANTGLQPTFMETDGSNGIWPLNFSMGKKYGLTQSAVLEERRSVELSSDAACKYLRDLYDIYKDWPKVITAFRIGAVRLNQVIRLANNSLEFKDIYKHLTAQEKEPIVQFYAAVAVMYYHKEFNITEQTYKAIESDTVSTSVPLSFGYLHAKLGIAVADLQELNPELKQSLVPCFGEPRTFRIPVVSKEGYNHMKDSFRIWLTKREPEIVKPGTEYDTIVRVVDSITYIEIKPRVKEPGTNGTSPAPKTPAPAPAKPVVPQKVWVWYKVKPGDGFYTLSDIFDCTTAELKAWNGIYSNTLMAGANLKFYVPYARQSYYQQINYMNQTQKRNLAVKD